MAGKESRSVSRAVTVSDSAATTPNQSHMAKALNARSMFSETVNVSPGQMEWLRQKNVEEMNTLTANYSAVATMGSTTFDKTLRSSPEILDDFLAAYNKTELEAIKRGSVGSQSPDDSEDIVLGFNFDRSFENTSPKNIRSRPKKKGCCACRNWCGKKRFLGFKMRPILPTSKFYKCWVSVILLLLSYTATVMPYRIAFGDDGDLAWFVVEVFVDLLFISDLIVNFLLAYRDPYTGKLVQDFRKISWHYLTGWFIVDLAACIPVGLFFGVESYLESNDESGNRTTRFIRLPRAIRLLRLLGAVRLFKISKSGNMFRSLLQWYFEKRAIISSVMFALVIIVVAHCLGCLWYFFARIADFDNETWVRRSLSAEAIVDGEWTTLVRCGGLDDLTTLEDIEECLRPKIVRYIASIYWVVTTVTTVGYGDITPGKPAEYVMALVVMCLGVAMYANILSRLTSLLTANQGRKEYKDKKLQSLYQFCKSAKLNSLSYGQLSQQLIHSIESANARGPHGKELGVLLSHFPYVTRSQIAYKVHGGMHLQLDFFKAKGCGAGYRDVLITEIAPFLEPFTIVPDYGPARIGDVSKVEKFAMKSEQNHISLDGMKEIYSDIHPPKSLDDIGEVEHIHQSSSMYSRCVMGASGILYRHQDKADSIFFLYSGLIGPLHLGEDIHVDNASPMFWFKEKSYFGEVEVLLQEPRKFTVKAFTPCKLFRLREGALLQAFSRLPSLRRTMRRDAGKKLQHFANLMSEADVTQIATDRRRCAKVNSLLAVGETLKPTYFTESVKQRNKYSSKERSTARVNRSSETSNHLLPCDASDSDMAGHTAGIIMHPQHKPTTTHIPEPAKEETSPGNQLKELKMQLDSQQALLEEIDLRVRTALLLISHPE